VTAVISATVSGGSIVSASSVASSPISVSVYGSATTLDGTVGSLTPVSSSSSSVSQGGYALSPEKPTEMVWLSTRLEAGSFGVSIKSSTGYVAVMWWDGSVSTYGTGNAGAYISITKTIPTSGAYARSAPKSVYLWAASGPGAYIQTGVITGLLAASKKITALNVSDCESLASLSCDTNDMEHLSVSRCTSLASLACYGNRLRSLDILTCPALTTLYCQNNRLESLDVSKSTKLIILQCNTNSIPTLNLASNPDLVSVFCHNNLISSLSFTVAKKVTSLNCSNNRITVIRAPAVSFANPYGANLETNLLSADSLNQFYSDLAVAASQGVAIYVAGNVGAESDSTAVAVGKGYVVYG
jgi:hypothetical protein